MQKRVAELFAGVGGFHVAFDKLNSGWDFVYANQWEPGKKIQYAYENYLKHYGADEIVSNEDINKVNKKEIPDFDLLVGGFPCQDYSVARTKAKGIEGKKGVLWWDIRDTIVAKTPPFILLENVDRLLSSPGPKQRGRDFGMILYTLFQLGYGVQWRMVNAADYGFPQRRRRVFIFAYRKDTNYYKTINVNEKNYEQFLTAHSSFANTLPMKDKLTLKKKIVIDDYLDIVDFSDNFTFKFENTGILHENLVFTGKYESNYSGAYQILDDIIEESVNDESLFLDNYPERMDKFQYLKGPKRLQRKSAEGYEYVYSEGGMVFPDPLDRPARTMLTSEHSVNRSTHVVKDKETGRLRLLTPLEAERIQTFPDNWTAEMPNSARYFMMGNALVTGLVSKMGEALDEIIMNETSMDKLDTADADLIKH